MAEYINLLKFRYGTTREHFAKISEKNYKNASKNNYAQFQKALSVD